MECGVTGVSDGGVTGHPGGPVASGVPRWCRGVSESGAGGVWRVASGVWRVECSARRGVTACRVASGVWPVACHGGVWSAGRMASGLSRVACCAMPVCHGGSSV